MKPEEGAPDEVSAASLPKEQGWSALSFKERFATLRILHGKGPLLSCHSLAILTGKIVQ